MTEKYLLVKYNVLQINDLLQVHICDWVNGHTSIQSNLSILELQINLEANLDTYIWHNT
jgi:hypothetical protein